MEEKIKLGLPKGRMEKGVFELLKAAGIQVRTSSRAYRPTISLPEFQTKILKPQDIVEMLHMGRRDIGFAGADWVRELNAELIELLDLGLDPVRLVAAAPKESLEKGALPKKHLVIASEYEELTKQWIKEKGLDATFVHSHGATEVFPPEDADCIVDNTSTGSTLKANGLEIVDELMTSSTRLYAHPKVLEDPEKKEAIDKLVLVLRSVLDARKRVMVEVNVSKEDLEAVVDVLPCMRRPSVAELHSKAGFVEGYVVKAAVPSEEIARLVPVLKERGATDIVVSLISQLVP
jgi:ATP phosphoribosyltransferase